MRGVVLSIVLLLTAGGQAAAAVAPVRIASDPFDDGVSGQHATIAEPDSLSFGQTVVTAFQVGRVSSGGAAAIGWATSTDGGRTWRNGILPSLTPFTAPAGPYSRVSDPVVAYDRVHGVWLISILALTNTPTLPTSAVVTARSTDGVAWSAPVVTAPDRGFFDHDKNWIVCDNGPTSRFAGRCYTVWTDVSSEGSLALATSLDGGLTWGAETVAPPGTPAGNGALPLVLPDGTLTIPYRAFNGAVVAAASRDGGASFAPAVAAIGSGAAGGVRGFRAPPLPSGEVDAAGRVYLAWHTCAFRDACLDRSGVVGNDLALSTSLDGATWTPPRRIPLGGADVSRVLPGLGVDATTAGASARLAVVYYVLDPSPCDLASCRLRATFASSSDGGVRWSAPIAVGPQPMELAWLAQTSAGRMLGDYFSTSFVGGGVAVPVFTAALPPAGSTLRQDLYAAAVPPLAAARLALTVRSFAAPRRVRGGAILRATLAVARSDGAAGLGSARVSCDARLGGGRRLAVAARRVRGGSVECAWRVPRGRGGTIRGVVAVRVGDAVASRRFTSRAA